MRRVSTQPLLMVALVLFLALGAAQLVRGLFAGTAIQVRLQAALSHPTLRSGVRQTTYLKVDLTGFDVERRGARTPVNVALVLDQSGSMAGQKIEQAREAAVLAVSHLGPGDVVSVISYANTARVVVPPIEVTDKDAIAARIRSLRAEGGTALYAGVSEGAQQLRLFLDANRVNRVILLSDGQANEGPSTPEALGDLGATLLHQGISVTTIGLGLDYNEDLMEALARRSDGNHSFARHVDDLAAIYNQEFGDVLSVVAQDVSVTIECRDGIRPVRVLGRDAEIDGQQVRVALNQLYSKQDKYVVLEVEAQPAAAGGEQEVARITTSYANMRTRERDVLTRTLSAYITDSAEAVERDVDKEAMVAALEQHGILNEERAVLLRDQGRTAEAEQMLQDNAAFLEAKAALYGADALHARARQSLEAAANLDDARWNQQRKTLRSDHYRAKTQQSY